MSADAPPPAPGAPPVGVDPDGDHGPAVPRRRAAYADNPVLGTKGMRTQQRILDAALEVFGEHGYDRATLADVAGVAGCSRVAIYQYFTGKDDVFRHLAGQVARQMRASAEALDPITADEAGWHALRAWVGRYTDIHDRYEPVFAAFGAATASDAELAGGSARTGGRLFALVRSRVRSPTLPSRLLDPATALLLASVTRVLAMADVLREASPEAYDRDRVATALTDLLHRSLVTPFADGAATSDGGSGTRPDQHPATDPGIRPEPRRRDRTPAPAPALDLDPTLRHDLDRVAALEEEAARPSRRALAALLAAGPEVVVRRGHLGVRVDDLVEAAGVSHGALYRYFDNVDDLVQVVAVRALRAVSSALGTAPVAGDRAALRRWLRHYAEVHAEHGPVLQVWTQVAAGSGGAGRAAAIDWGRRRMARFLADRPDGDPDLDGLLLLAVVETFGSVPRSAQELDAAVHVVEQGFLAAPR